MTITKLPSGNYRIREMRNGKRYTLTIEHRPSKTEAYRLIDEVINKDKLQRETLTFEDAALRYIDAKSTALSPASVGEYTLKVKRISEGFRGLIITDIKQYEIQKEINSHSNMSRKSLRDLCSFIQSVLQLMVDGYTRYTITFPMEKKKPEPYIPTDKDVSAMIDAAKGTQYECAVILGAFGCRRSEICAITDKDVEKNGKSYILHINKAYVQNKSTKEWVIKSTKTTESERDIIITEDIYVYIKVHKCAYSGYPGAITNFLSREQKKLGLPHFSLHKERHYFATTLSQMGVPEADILKMGGWSTDHVMKEVYRHATIHNEKDRQQAITDRISGKIFRA